VEFTVGTNGQPEDITIVDASHTRFFRKAAVNAVSQWKFEPHIIRGETVAQRTFARISFKLQ
jgi:protein TonB